MNLCSCRAFDKLKPSHVASYYSRVAGVEVLPHCSLSVDYKIRTGSPIILLPTLLCLAQTDSLDSFADDITSIYFPYFAAPSSSACSSLP